MRYRSESGDDTFPFSILCHMKAHFTAILMFFEKGSSQRKTIGKRSVSLRQSLNRSKTFISLYDGLANDYLAVTYGFVGYAIARQ